eukprot:TRINITY_DN229_c0_g3_i1.p1 TRINITY_DN229_c0_g3~~TRINITY_DN229_c0_g3_i1.p1  ORF type:complete len:784 (+),score=170.24 TRINITY_DN229_c0_g3_i1:73-2424(+)
MTGLLRFWKQGDVRHFYDLKQELGKGTFSVVRLGINKKTGKKSAIKIINKKITNIETKQMLETEINILQRVDHPNVIGLQSMYETKTHLFLVMEYVEGGELFDRIIERGCFSEKDAANIIRQILEAVKYLHSLGVVHRDLKPENVLCATKEALDVKIADFGLSKILDGDNKQVLQTCCGTPSYAAPELLLCEGYAEPVDTWAVGVILYTLLSGCLPFFGETHTELFERILAGAFSFPDPEWTNISESAKSLVSSLLTANPNKRLTADQALKHPWILGATGTQLSGLTERMEKIRISRKASTLRERYNAAAPQSVLGPQMFDSVSADEAHENKAPTRPIDSTRSALVWEDERDWKLMSKGTKVVKYNKDQFILKEGNINRDFYRVKSGSVRVEKKRGDNSAVTLMKMGKNMMFGEISMLQSSGMITASVVADEETELHQVNVVQLKELFKTEHELAERFFRELALKQAQRLTQARQRIEEILERESASVRSARASEARAQSQSFQPTVNSHVAQFSKTFGLEETCFVAVPCRWKRTLLHAGMLYISEKNICGTYSFFALKTKHVIPYSAITQVEGSNLELRFTWINNKKPIKASVMLQTEEEFKLVMENVESLWKEMRPRENSEKVLLTSIANPLTNSQVTEVDQSLSDALTADDWKLILEKSKQYVFRKNQVVIREGDSSPQNLYQLAHGRCRVEQQRPEDDSVVTLGILQSGETFGEISFLQDSQITASVVADEDGVEIYVIEGDYLNDIFNEHPGIPGRFYKYLATLISNRLHHREIDILS